ncbi:MAG: TetR/AcrR family transcriptional regulator [Acidimicrobiia bacterium]
MARPQEHNPEEILAAALTLFSEEGVNVSTARIAKAAGVSNGTLFNYFPTKQALIDSLYISIKTELADAIGTLDSGGAIPAQMRQVWNRWIAWARDRRDAYAVMTLLHQAGLASPQAQDVGAKAIEGPASVLTEAMERGMLVDLPLEYLAGLIQHQLDQTVMSELDDDQADVAFGVLWNGITKPKEKTL